MAGSSRDLTVRIRFGGSDSGLSRLLDSLAGSSHRAGAEILKTKRALSEQKGALRDVERQLAGSSGNVTRLIDEERRLATAIGGTNARLERQTKILGINRTVARAGEVGGEMVANGRAGLFGLAIAAAPMFAAAREGAQFQATQNKMRMLGLGEGAVKDLTAYAEAMKVAGSATKDNLRYLLEAQGTFRETGAHNPHEQLAGAKLMAPILAKMHVVDKATGKEMGEDEERMMLRFVEQAGGLNDPRRAKMLADGVFRARQSSGGNVNYANYQGFLAAAGSAGTHLNTRSMFADFEPLIAEIHEQAGVGLASAYNRATGITKNAAAAKDFMKLGMWDSSKVVLNSMGGVKEFKGNPLAGKAGKLLASDPVEFYKQIVLPAYGRAGIKGEDVTRQNSMLFGRSGGKLFNLIDKQLPTLMKSRESYQRTQSVDKAYGTTKDSFDGKLAQLKAAGSNFMVAASLKGGLLDNVVSLMTKATRALTAFTNWGNAHPTAFSWIGTIATDLLLIKGASAIAKIALGGVIGPAAKAWGLVSKIRTAGSVAEAFPAAAGALKGTRKAGGFLARRGGALARGVGKVASVAADLGSVAAVGAFGKIRSGATAMAGGFKSASIAGFGLLRTMTMLAVGGIAQSAATAFGVLRTAAIFLGQGMMRAGLMMLANPMVLIITAIGVAIGVAAYLIYTHWDKIKAAFGTALTFLSGLWTKFKDIGSHIISGLVDGIKNAFPGVALIIKALGKMLPEPLRKLLGIHSPSRVFAAIGGHMMTGLHNGIAGGQDGPIGRVRNLARQLTTSAATGTAALALAAAPAGATPRTHPSSASASGTASRPLFRDIVIHSQPGMDERQLADLVAHKVAEIMAQAQVRTRSSYADEPDWGSPL